jgi:hypothetical protein
MILEDAMSPDASGPVSVGTRGRPLGLCWIVYGIFRLIVAVWMLSFAGTATVMFGALLTRVPNPYSLMSVFHLMYAGWTVLSAASGIFGVLAGIALLAGAGVGRILGLVAAFLSLPFLPVGTTLGIYTLVIFLP